MAELAPGATGEPSPFTSAAGRWLDRIATWWALFGGLLFCAIVVMSIISIVGRKLFSAPIQGDMELLQMGSAIGAAAFLPLCEVYDHHIKVDAFTNGLSARARAPPERPRACPLAPVRSYLSAEPGRPRATAPLRRACTPPRPRRTLVDERPPRGRGEHFAQLDRAFD